MLAARQLAPLPSVLTIFGRRQRAKGTHSWQAATASVCVDDDLMTQIPWVAHK